MGSADNGAPVHQFGLAAGAVFIEALADWASCRAPAVGWMGAMFVGGLILGSLLWTVLNEVTTLTVTWLVIGVALGVGEGIASFFLPNIRPGQELEQIAT